MRECQCSKGARQGSTASLMRQPKYMDGSCISSVSGQCFSVVYIQRHRTLFSLLICTTFPGYLEQIADFAPAGLEQILGSPWGEGCLKEQFNECPAFSLLLGPHGVETGGRRKSSPLFRQREKLFFPQMHLFKIESSLGRWRKQDYNVVDLTSAVQQRYFSTQ